MDLTQLQQQLQTAIGQHSNTLPLSASTTGVADLDATIKQYFRLGSLTLFGIGSAAPVLTQSTGTNSVIATGIASTAILGISDPYLVVVFTLNKTINGTTLNASLAFAASSGWQIATSFPPLQDDPTFDQLSQISNACFVLTDYDHSAALVWQDQQNNNYSMAKPLTGLNMQLTATYTSPFGLLQTVLGSTQGLTFQGQVIDPTVPLLYIDANTGKSFGLGKVTLEQITITLSTSQVSMATEEEDPDGGDSDASGSGELYLDSQAILSGTLTTTTPMTVSTLIPYGGETLTLDIEFDDDNQRPTLDGLVEFFSQDVLQTSLPQNVQSIMQHIQIDGFAVTFSLQPFQVLSAMLDVSYVGSIPLIPGSDLIAFSGLDVVWTVTDPFDLNGNASASAQISGNLTLLNGIIGFEASMPQFTLAGGLNVDSPPIQLDLLLEHFGLPKDALPRLAIDSLAFDAEPSQSSYSLAADVETSWQIGNTGPQLDGLSFSLSYSETAVSGSIGTTITIGGVDLTLAAQGVSGQNSGWLFEIKSGATESIALGDLLAYLVTEAGVPSGAVPNSLSKLTLSDLDLQYGTNPLLFHFALTTAF